MRHIVKIMAVLLAISNIVPVQPSDEASGAIINVDMAPGVTPPPPEADSNPLANLAPGVPAPDFSPYFSVGNPIDLVFFAERKFPGEPTERAVEKMLNLIGESASDMPESITSESIISENLIINPVLYASRDFIHPEERIPHKWAMQVGRNRHLIERVLRSVGRIEVYHLNLKRMEGFEVGFIAGTGFVVAPNIVMTNRHVAETFAILEGQVPPYTFRSNGRGRPSARVFINFAGTYDAEPNLFPVRKVLYVGPKAGLDIALLEVEAPTGKTLPQALSLQTEQPSLLRSKPSEIGDEDRKMFTSGYPTIGHNQDKGRYKDLFRTLGVKRVSLGEFENMGICPYVDSSDHPFHDVHDSIRHRCTTLGGSSGSPLVHFGTATVWGLHFTGSVEVGAGNHAESIWDICALPEVRTILGPAADRPPSPMGPVRGFIPTLPDVVEQRSRPVRFVCEGDLEEGEAFPPGWFERGSDAHHKIKQAISATGLISVENHPDLRGSSGTCFVIAPGIVITRSFVLGDDVIDPRTLEFRPGLSEDEPIKVIVDFAQTRCVDPQKKFQVAEVKFYDETLGVALLKLDAPPEATPQPLTIASGAEFQDLEGDKVFVVSHPFTGFTGVSEPVYRAIFPPPYGVKRLSLGKLMEIGPDHDDFGRILHDCSTSAGSAGAPVVGLATGMVLGIHEGGTARKANYALPLPIVMQDPEIREIIDR